MSRCDFQQTFLFLTHHPKWAGVHGIVNKHVYYIKLPLLEDATTTAGSKMLGWMTDPPPVLHAIKCNKISHEDVAGVDRLPNCSMHVVAWQDTDTQRLKRNGTARR